MYIDEISFCAIYYVLFTCKTSYENKELREKERGREGESQR